MSKTFLVARREFLENLRTKTFWIGILAFPVILILSILVPMWLEKAKDVRTYAVVDHSGWLHQAVAERADLPDLEKVLTELRNRLKSGSRDKAEVPAVFGALAEKLGEISDAQIKLAARILSAGARPEGKEEIDAMAQQLAGASGSEVLSQDLRATLLKQYEPVRAWWKSLPSEEARKYAADLKRSRYQLVPLPAGGGEDTPAALNKKIEKGELFACFVIGKDPLAGKEGCKYVSNNRTDTSLKEWFSSLATAEVRKRRFEKENIDEKVAQRIQEPLEFEEKQIDEAGIEKKVESKDTARQWAPVVFVYLLWIAVFMISQMLLTNTVEEKSNRLIEVLLSSVSPLQLMNGKIGGIAATGLTMIGAWVLFFLATVKFTPYLIGKDLPFDLSVIVRDPVYLASFVVYFFLGYLLYAAILVGIGSVCNSLKEAQNLMQPVVLLLIVPILAMMPIGKDPNGALAKIMSYFPPFTPFVMMNRAAGPPTTTEYVVTGVLLVLSIVAAMWAAAKIFRIGVLMTGKPPKLREILRWVRAPTGMVPPRREPGAATPS